jgi:hypothetical protein
MKGKKRKLLYIIMSVDFVPQGDNSDTLQVMKVSKFSVFQQTYSTIKHFCFSSVSHILTGYSRLASTHNSPASVCRVLGLQHVPPCLANIKPFNTYLLTIPQDF